MANRKVKKKPAEKAKNIKIIVAVAAAVLVLVGAIIAAVCLFGDDTESPTAPRQLNATTLSEHLANLNANGSIAFYHVYEETDIVLKETELSGQGVEVNITAGCYAKNAASEFFALDIADEASAEMLFEYYTGALVSGYKVKRYGKTVVFGTEEFLDSVISSFS